LEETLSEHEVLADAPATVVEEEVETRAAADEAPAVVNPDPPAAKKPRLESLEKTTPKTMPAASAMTASAAEVEATAEALKKTLAPPKRFKKKSILVKKISL
jgi:hypothetical protein